MGKQKRNADEMRRTIEDFKKSGLKRWGFCQRHHIAISTLDYWRRARLGIPGESERDCGMMPNAIPG